jgi:predicted metal-dependent hydrolase
MAGVVPIHKTSLETMRNLRKNMREVPNRRAIILRNPSIDKGLIVKKHWLNNDPVATAWFTALSASFPRGEAYFIESLRANIEPLPPALERDTALFIAQEAAHAREHNIFNRLSASAGYDLSAIDARLSAFIAQTSQASNFINLLVTACLEHFTALIAHDLLSAPALFSQTDPAIAALWRWHAVEEIEHKGVAYDVWAYVARGLSPWRRWKIRCKIMAKVTVVFMIQRSADARELLEQQGMTRAQAARALRAYLWGRRGAMWRLAKGWARWFMPGFHPWQHDNSALIQP